MTGTILITGATSGIGMAAARRFVREGWKAVGTGRRRDRLDRLSAELGDAFHPLPLDMRATDAIAPAIETLPAGFSAIDLLLNNAGLAPPAVPFQDSDLDDAHRIIETNISGLVVLTHHLLPRLIERRGMVINLSSVAATYPYRGGSVYGGSKAFVRQFSLDLRCDLHGTGVRVTSIEPGMVETEFTLVRTKGDQAASDALYAEMDPMTGEDIADTMWWIASQPPHFNVNTIELMPVNQSFAGFAVARRPRL